MEGSKLAKRRHQSKAVVAIVVRIIVNLTEHDPIIGSLLVVPLDGPPRHSKLRERSHACLCKCEQACATNALSKADWIPAARALKSARASS